MFNFADGSNIELIVLARSGFPQADEARQKLFLECKPLLDKLAYKSVTLGGLDGLREDLQQEAYLAFLEALTGFQIERGVKFTTFLYRVVKNRLMEFTQNEWGFKNHVVNREETSNDNLDEDDFDDDDFFHLGTVDPGFLKIEEQETNSMVFSYISNLPKRQKEVVNNVFWRNLPCNEVARQIGVSPQMVNKILNQVYTKGQRRFNRHYAFA